ncbi:MAG: hypothetical protein ACRD2D_03375, partial [Terriglobales bacterium]
MSWKWPWAVLAAVSLLPALRAQSPIWNHAGPGAMQNPAWGAVAGPIVALAAGSGESAIYAAGAGGVWQRTSAGWTALGPNQPVTALAVLPSGGLIAGTAVGLFQNASVAGGWSAVGAGVLGTFTVTAIALDPANPQHWLVGTSAGLFATADAGATFAATALSDPVLAVGWQSASVLVATTRTIEASRDDGATFA